MQHVLVAGIELSPICQLPLKHRGISWVVYSYTRPLGTVASMQLQQGHPAVSYYIIFILIVAI